MLVTSERIEGKELETLGLVRAYDRPFFGEVDEKVIARVEQEMVNNANGLGADAIVAVRYDIYTSGNDRSSVLVSGTAVKFK